VNAARGQFAAKGFVGARLTDIAEAAGLTTGAFYRHFATKVDVVGVLFEEFADELCMALVDAPDLEAFCLTWLRVHEAHFGTVRAAEDITLNDDGYWVHRRRLRKLWASSALRHISVARDAKHRRILSLVLIDTLDYYFFTRIRGWAKGTVDAAATNMANLFSEGLYGDNVSSPVRERPSTLPQEMTPEHDVAGAAKPEIAPLFRWQVAEGRVVPTSQRGRSQRTAVLRSAAQVFVITGYEDATVPQIAAHAGVSAGTVYRYFQDKRDLFLCLLSGAESSIHEESLWPLGPDGKLRVREALHTYFTTRERERAVYRVWRTLLDTDEEMERLWVATRHDFQAALSRLVRRSQRTGLISSKFDAQIVSELLVALCDGPAHAWFDLGWEENDGVSLDDLADVAAARIGDDRTFRSATD
jgi:AcrR family transcriptional regulator